MFGDTQSGHVFSYLFGLPDPHARGSRRSYSLLLLMTDRVQLVNLWLFLTSSFRTVVERLKQFVARRLETEAALSAAEPALRSSPPSPPLEARRSPGLSMRLQPEAYIRRLSSRQLVSLAQLCGRDDIFELLHSWHAWILLASSRQRREILHEGPPLVRSSVGDAPAAPDTCAR